MASVGSVESVRSPGDAADEELASNAHGGMGGGARREPPSPPVGIVEGNVGFEVNVDSDSSDSDSVDLARVGSIRFMRDSEVVGDLDVESEEFDVFISPKKRVSWIPKCEEELIPRVGQMFESLGAAVAFYEKYAKKCKFDARLDSQRKSSDGTVTHRQMVCSRMGHNPGRNPTYESANWKGKGVRKTKSGRCGCKARVRFKFRAGGYEVSQFDEAHNHQMATVKGSQFLRSRRKMSFEQQALVVDLSKVNIGASTAFRVAKEQAGGFENVGCQEVDFNNFHRDVIAYIGENDAQMVLNKLSNKREVEPDFFYEYAKKEGQLSALFWADGTSQANYSAFGDVMTFDATYNMNKYKMIFVPFTGVDNHGNSVTFAAALITNESELSYKWVLKMFLKCMDERAPMVVVTDEDPALKKAVPEMLPNSHHRFCMWHIMKKVSQKVGLGGDKLQDFRSKLRSVVYGNYHEVEDFESSWCRLLVEYDLTDNSWLCDKFDLRSSWIPCYFVDTPLGGLLRSTSRSESQNSFFGRYLNKDLTLLGFFVGFDSAMERQRHTQLAADHQTRTKKPALKTPSPFEEHARELYTHEIFYIVQSEILGACFEVSVSIVEALANGKRKKFVLQDERQKRRTFEVVADLELEEFSCQCKMFEGVGYLCKHIFFAMKSCGLSKIPFRYCLPRWGANATGATNEERDEGPAAASSQPGNRDLWAQFKGCVSMAGSDAEKIAHITSALAEVRTFLESTGGGAPVSGTKDRGIESVIGSSRPGERSVESPAYVNTKGGCSTSKKRMISAAEQAANRAKKAPRRCNCCNEMVYHDSRNCPLNPRAQKPVAG